MSENKQRNDYTPLEESAGYQDLHEIKKWDAQQIADHIGKSKSYVYARMKLAALCAEARAALEAGTIDYSKALLIARFSSEKLQKAAVKKIGDYGGERVSYPRVFEMLRDGFMVNLAGAPFAHDDTGYFRFEKIAGRRGMEDAIKLPTCAECPSNSANDGELQAELGSAHMCTDKPCFDLKVVQFWKRRQDDAKKEGRTVITGDEAKAALKGIDASGYMGQAYNAEYLDLDAETDAVYPEPEPEPKNDADDGSPEFMARYDAWERASSAWKPPTYRQVLGTAAPQGVLVEAAKGKLRELVPLKDVRPALKEKGLKITVPDWMRTKSGATTDDAGTAADRSAERAKEEERLKVEGEWRTRLLREIHAKFKGPFKRPDLERIAEVVTDTWGDAFDKLYPGRPSHSALKDDELTKMIVIATVANEADDTYGKPSGLLELAQRCKIDAKALRTQVVKDLKPTAAPQGDEAETAPKKAAAKKKPAAKK